MRVPGAEPGSYPGSYPGIALAETLPTPSIEALAGAMFVATCVACWIAVASTATAPLVAASELLSRVGGVSR
jgi:hypothetical protein